MISDETFYKEVMQGFKDLRNKMDELHEDTNEKITDLCDKITKTNSKIDEHLAINEALEKKTEKDLVHRDRKFYVIIALLSVGFTIYELTKDLI